MNIGYLTDRGRRRPTNEDAVKVVEDLNFFMLADGVGGNRSGEIASEQEQYVTAVCATFPVTYC